MYIEPMAPTKKTEQEGGAEEDHHNRRLATSLELPEALMAVLRRRGLEDEDQIKAFLQPNLADLPDPDLLLGMAEAVELVGEALASHQPIVIYADYDVDGLSAGAILYLFLKSLGHRQLHYLLPHRLKDGYGVHLQLLIALRSQLSAKTSPLLITTDCGINDHEAIVGANQEGFKVIVTDHHQPSPPLPPAAAIINPWQAGCPFPCKNLAGVGVAFYLLMGLRRHLLKQGFWSAGNSPPRLKEYLDLVALGTVADMVSLRGANRILTRIGLEVLQAGKRPGLNALAKISEITANKTVVTRNNKRFKGKVNSGAINRDSTNHASAINRDSGSNRPFYASDISFALAPRLNAAGRLEEPETAFRLLISDDPTEAQVLAEKLEEFNRRRRELSDQVYQEAKQRALEYQQVPSILIFADDHWHPGILGIAATRLTRDFKRPVILFNRVEQTLKGSGRSIEGLDLLAAVESCQAVLIGYGGHAAALGLSLEEAKLATFSQLLELEIGRRLAVLTPTIETVDWVFPQAGHIDPELTASYHLLEPFGPGNPEPLFQVQGILRQTSMVGCKHLRFYWQQPGIEIPGIAFGFSDHQIDQQADYQTGWQSCFNQQIDFNREAVEMVFVLRRNLYQDQASWQLQAQSIQKIPRLSTSSSSA